MVSLGGFSASTGLQWQSLSSLWHCHRGITGCMMLQGEGEAGKQNTCMQYKVTLCMRSEPSRACSECPWFYTLNALAEKKELDTAGQEVPFKTQHCNK